MVALMSGCDIFDDRLVCASDGRIYHGNPNNQNKTLIDNKVQTCKMNSDGSFLVYDKTKAAQ